jgi:hypothetical protein
LGAEDIAMAESRQPRLPEYEARCSFIDGTGSQLVMLSWMRPDGSLKGVNVLYQDQWGIKECYGIDEIEKAHWGKLIHELNEQGFGSFQIPFDYASSLVMDARAINRRTRHKLPIAYAVWRPFIEGSATKKKAHPSLPAIDPLSLDDEVQALAMQGDELFHLPEFASWLYEPASSLEPYVTRYWSTFGLLDSSTTEKPAQKRKARMRDKDQQILLEQLVDEALDSLIDEKWRHLYEARLRRQAMLLQLAKRDQDTTLIRAVAALLHPDSHIPTTDQPFLRAMLRNSIEQGPIRIMMEALSRGHLDPIPLNILGQE